VGLKALNPYTHAPSDYDERVRSVLEEAADDLLTNDPEDGDDGAKT